ncbi:hypothetical protein C2G38_2220380 [Gigaspora rosea]|uniref:Uncharacterized protein n=1 Tax=Gigaspora rosea TaxID=44941 RepID=A0A397U4G8_9GLOM|nr:hypothetical protein C2G38_2220380 [Gigaspora rosea]
MDQPKPLFEYTNYITSIENDFYDGIKDWLYDEGYYELEYAVKCSLIVIFLRTGKNLRHLNLDETIRNQLIFENLYENTNITSINFYLTYSIFKSKAIDVLEKIRCKNSPLETLDLRYNKFDQVKELADALCKNNTLKYLYLYDNNFGPDVGKAFAKTLDKNTTLLSLDLSDNNLGSDGEKALANALYKNTTLTLLYIRRSSLGSEEGKVFANALCKNTVLTSLDLVVIILIQKKEKH